MEWSLHCASNSVLGRCWLSSSRALLPSALSLICGSLPVHLAFCFLISFLHCIHLHTDFLQHRNLPENGLHYGLSLKFLEQQILTRSFYYFLPNYSNFYQFSVQKHVFLEILAFFICFLRKLGGNCCNFVIRTTHFD